MRHWLEDGCRIEFSNRFCNRFVQLLVWESNENGTACVTHSVFLESTRFHPESTWFHMESTVFQSTPVFLIFSHVSTVNTVSSLDWKNVLWLKSIWNDWNQMESLGNSLKIMKNARKQFRTLSMAFHDAQILSLPNMFLQWDRGGPRHWPEDCCRIG